MFETLVYHEGGHLLSPFGYEREYADENDFGGGQCPEDDVMSKDGISNVTSYRHENQVYCDTCIEEIQAGIDKL